MNEIMFDFCMVDINMLISKQDLNFTFIRLMSVLQKLRHIVLNPAFYGVFIFHCKCTVRRSYFQLHPYSQKVAKDVMSFLVQTRRFMSLPRTKLGMLMYSIIFYLKSGLKHW